MITFATKRVMLVTIVASVAAYGHNAGAAEPTLTDVAACNQHAAQQTGANALPAPPGAPGKELTQRAPDGTREPRELPAHGGVPVAGAPGARPAQPPAQSGAAAGEKTDPTGSFISQSPDPLLQGMAADRADDPAYRAAYRACMRAKTAR
jgi:hypothetical protein